MIAFNTVVTSVTMIAFNIITLVSVIIIYLLLLLYYSYDYAFCYYSNFHSCGYGYHNYHVVRFCCGYYYYYCDYYRIDCSYICCCYYSLLKSWLHLFTVTIIITVTFITVMISIIYLY